MGSDDRIRRSLPELTGPQREEAMTRFATLRPFLEEGVPLARSAAETAVPIRTARRWLARYQSDGLVGLARPVRSDTGRRRMPAELVELIEGMALRKPRPSVAAIHRRLKVIAKEKGWLMPSIRSVHSVVSDLDPALVTLAQDGAAAYRDRFEMIHRHRAGKPNAIWQADHTEPPWRSARRSGARRTRPGRSAASRTSSTSITAPTSPARISNRSPPTCALPSPSRRSPVRRGAARSSACSAPSTPSCWRTCPAASITAGRRRRLRCRCRSSTPRSARSSLATTTRASISRSGFPLAPAGSPRDGCRACPIAWKTWTSCW